MSDLTKEEVQAAIDVLKGFELDKMVGFGNEISVLVELGEQFVKGNGF